MERTPQKKGESNSETDGDRSVGFNDKDKRRDRGAIQRQDEREGSEKREGGVLRYEAAR